VLVFEHATFSHPTSSLTKISPFPWEQVYGLWDVKSEDVRLSVRAISFQDFQPMWSQSTNVTDRQRDSQTARQKDGQTDDMRSQYRTLHYSASRGKQCTETLHSGAAINRLSFKDISFVKKYKSTKSFHIHAQYKVTF